MRRWWMRRPYIGLYTKLRKTRTFEMAVIQKPHIGKLSRLANVIFTYGCLYQYHWISAKWPTIDLTILLYSGCVNMQKYDHISKKKSSINKVFAWYLSNWDKACCFCYTSLNNHGKSGITVKIVWKMQVLNNLLKQYMCKLYLFTNHPV